MPAFAGPDQTLAKFDRPMLQLSERVYPEGVDSEAAYRAWLADRRGETLGLAEGAGSDPCRLASVHLTVANWILAHEMEPFASAYLQGVTMPPDADAAGLLDGVDRHLAKAADALDGCEADDDVLMTLEDGQEALGAFAMALRALLVVDADAETLREAALSLSLHRESSIEGVASAAKLLQACLFARSERRDLAMRVLPLVGEPMAKEASNHEYFSRLLRCRQVLDRGGYAATWSLLLLCEEAAADHFDDLAEQAEAERSAAVLKFDVCRAWIGSAEGEARERTLAWCDSAISRVSRDVFGGDTANRVLRLPHVMPMIVEPLAVEEAEPEDRSEEAAVVVEPEKQPDEDTEGDNDDVVQPK